MGSSPVRVTKQFPHEMSKFRGVFAVFGHFWRLKVQLKTLVSKSVVKNVGVKNRIVP